MARRLVESHVDARAWLVLSPLMNRPSGIGYRGLLDAPSTEDRPIAHSAQGLPRPAQKFCTSSSS
jgi:hypothetical protein